MGDASERLGVAGGERLDDRRLMAVLCRCNRGAESATGGRKLRQRREEGAEAPSRTKAQVSAHRDRRVAVGVEAGDGAIREDRARRRGHVDGLSGLSGQLSAHNAVCARNVGSEAVGWWHASYAGPRKGAW